VFDQKFSAKYICKTFGIHYTEISDLSKLKDILPSFFEKDEYPKQKLIEIFTPKDENANILNNYFKTIKPI
jgi:2-succinyl-5-enolpyruvyl-6-hydroxy-3-cyclohexene-1-carboxylate synthase